MDRNTPPDPGIALYCRRTGRRLPPGDGRVVGDREILAVAVFDDGTSIGLTHDVVIGRAPDTDRRVRSGRAMGIVVDASERGMSRCHALIRITSAGLVVTDLGSHNGTDLLDESGDWTPLMAGIGHSVTDGRPIRLGSRSLSVYRTRR